MRKFLEVVAILLVIGMCIGTIAFLRNAIFDENPDISISDKTEQNGTDEPDGTDEPEVYTVEGLYYFNDSYLLTLPAQEQTFTVSFEVYGIFGMNEGTFSGIEVTREPFEIKAADGPSLSGYVDSSIACLDFGETQEVSKELYDFLHANGTFFSREISGVYKFNLYGNDVSSNIVLDFTSNGESFDEISFDYSSGSRSYIRYGLSDAYVDGSWSDTDYQCVDFGEAREVSVYNAFLIAKYMFSPENPSFQNGDPSAVIVSSNSYYLLGDRLYNLEAFKGYTFTLPILNNVDGSVINREFYITEGMDGELELASMGETVYNSNSGWVQEQLKVVYYRTNQVVSKVVKTFLAKNAYYRNVSASGVNIPAYSYTLKDTIVGFTGGTSYTWNVEFMSSGASYSEIRVDYSGTDAGGGYEFVIYYGETVVHSPGGWSDLFYQSLHVESPVSSASHEFFRFLLLNVENAELLYE